MCYHTHPGRKNKHDVVGTEGLEPTTSGPPVQRSPELSYVPKAMVEVTGFEPALSASRTRRDTGLRYTSKKLDAVIGVEPIVSRVAIGRLPSLATRREGIGDPGFEPGRHGVRARSLTNLANPQRMWSARDDLNVHPSGYQPEAPTV